MNMKHGMAVVALLLTTVAWGGVLGARPHDGPAAAFKSLRMGLEVDLPMNWHETLRRGDFHTLPAELSLSTESGEGLVRVQLFRPQGGVAIDLLCPDALSLGVSELHIECENATLAEALLEYPSGEYYVRATGLSGKLVEGRVVLSHVFPAPVRILSPLPGEPVSIDSAQVAWTRSVGVARYLLEVENDSQDFHFEITLPPTSTSFTLPSGILLADQEYEYSLLVQGDTDNELEVEGAFRTAP